MRESKGNMFEWVTHTWSPIVGECSHKCSYCYMRKFPQKPIHLKENVLAENLGVKNVIFVCSGTDLFADDVPSLWIVRVLDACKKYNSNTYLFQTKNPKRYLDFKEMFPKNTYFGVTIETNEEFNLDKSPTRKSRADYIRKLNSPNVVLTIEPIMQFELEPFVRMIREIKPLWVNIGADSQGHNLPEPNREKIIELVARLKEFTEIKKKVNLERLK